MFKTTICFISCVIAFLLFLNGCARTPVKVKEVPPDSGECKLSRKVYMEDGEWKVAIYPGNSVMYKQPVRPECIEQEREMERLYIEHILNKK